MTTSGVTTFTLTTTELLTAAFEKIGVATEGEALTDDMYVRGKRALNLLVKTWGAMPHLWTQTETWLPLVAGQSEYALNVAMRVLSVRRRITSGTLDTPMTELSRQEYFDLPNKTVQSVPVNWYFNPQQATRTLYLWPTASTATAAAQTIRITYLRRMDDMVGSNDELDMPQEWLEAVVYNLARRLMATYPVNDPQMRADIIDMSDRLFAQLKGWDTEPASIFLQPDTRWA